MHQALDGEDSIENAILVRKTAVFDRKQRFLWSEWGTQTTGILSQNQAPYQLGYTWIVIKRKARCG